MNTLVYRCRNCREVFAKPYTQGVKQFVALLLGKPDTTYSTLETHNCGKGEIGVAELVRLKTDDERAQ